MNPQHPNSASNSGRARSSTITIVLATIGGLALFSTFLLFILTAIALRGGISAVPEVTGDCIGVVPIEGVISDPAKVLDAIQQFSQDDRVKAVVLRIDSPGGAVGASQEIFSAARRLDKEKPVVASLGNVAASGGFYSAVGARYIVSNPGTITGSIGVIMKIPNLGRLMEKLGIKTTVLKSGRLKDLASVTRDLTEEERQVLQGVMDDVHDQFISDVAEGRGLDPSKVRAIADGRIFSGRQALGLKLVDELGGLQAAVNKAAEFAGMEGRPEVCYPRQDKLSVLRRILEESGARMVLRLAELLSYAEIEAVPR